MANYDVSVTMNLVDNVTKRLSNIEKNIDKVVKTAQAYNTVVEQITRSLNLMTVSAGKAATATNRIATNMAKLTDRMGVKLEDGSARVGKVSTQMEILKTNIGKTTAAQKYLNDAIRQMPGPAILRSYNSSVNNYSSSANRAARETERFNKKLYMNVNASGKARVGMSSLASSIQSVIGAYLGFESVKTALDWSDEITLTQGKLSILTDDVEGLMNRIYQMSQETRTSYMDNASQMAKMWQLTGGTDGIFDTEDKLIEFNELLNKSFRIGGSGPREISASIYQLTQALSSGRLQGDELRSLGENAPYFVKKIVKSLEDAYNAGKPLDEQIKLTYNDLKNLGATGELTSEVIVNAMLNAADEIREDYKNLKPTFQDVFETLKNQVQYIATPVLQSLNQILNSDAFAKTAQAFVKIFAVVMAILEPMIKGFLFIGEIISNNWSVVEPIIWGIVGALAAYYTYLGLIKVYTLAVEGATKLLAGVEGMIKGIAAAYQGWQLASALLRQALGLELSQKQAIILMNYQQALSEGAVQKTKLHTLITTLSNTKATIMEAWAKVKNATATGILTAATSAFATSAWAAASAVWAMLAPLLTVIAIILAVVAVFYIAVAAYNYFTGSTISATGLIVGAFYGLYAAVYDVFAGIWNFLVEVAEFIRNIFVDPVYVVKSLFGNMAKGVLYAFKYMLSGIEAIANSATSLINMVIDGYNAIPFLGDVEHVGKVSMTSSVDSAIKGIDSWIGNKPSNLKSYDSVKLAYKDIGEYANKGYDKGANWEGGFVDGLKDWAKNSDTLKQLEKVGNGDALTPEWGKYPESIDIGEMPTVDGGDYPKETMDAIDKIKGNTDDINENTKITAEDLKYLRDLAEQRVINRFTTAEIKITNHMNNNINSDRDLDGIANYLVEEMYKGANAYAEGAHY